MPARRRRSSPFEPLEVAKPATPMTPQGGSGMLYTTEDPTMPMESPDTFRRRITPAVGEPSSPPSQIQEIINMLHRGGR